MRWLYALFIHFHVSLMTFEDSLLDDFAREFQKSVYSDLFLPLPSYAESILMSILGFYKIYGQYFQFSLRFSRVETVSAAI